MKQLALDIARPAPPTLDNFVAGRNAELLQCLQALAAGRGPERFVYVWGEPGSGRTHLLRGLAAAGAAHGVAAYLEGAAGVEIDGSLTQAGVVAIDDVQRCSEREQARLFNLYNALRESGGRMVASGDTPPPRLRLRQDLATRLAWGLVYEVHALTDHEKAQALRDHAGARGVRLSDEVCNFLLTRVRRDMASLLAMLDALDRYSLETKRQITLPLARELLRAATGAHGAEAGSE